VLLGSVEINEKIEEDSLLIFFKFILLAVGEAAAAGN
jgi:hypothetical protein